MKLYHGTSADNLKAILKDGFNGMRGNQIWKVSAGLNYFWNPADMVGSECETQEEAESRTQQYAKESAECGLAKAKDCRRVVFEIEITQKQFKSLFSEDNSCKNMDFAVMATETISAKFITRYWIDENSLDFFRCYFAGIQMGSDLKIQLDLTNAEKAMVDAIYKSDAACSIAESLSDIELEEVVVKKLATA